MAKIDFLAVFDELVWFHVLICELGVIEKVYDLSSGVYVLACANDPCILCGIADGEQYHA